MATREDRAQQHEDTVRHFARLWQVCTADNNITLYSFRRFKTAHLVNLRFLEAEIAELDHRIYQAGLSLNIPPSPADRLGLKHSKRNSVVPPIEDVITRELVVQLRDLIKTYDEALLRLNSLLSMDTFSLIDDTAQCSLRPDLTLHEMYKTRMLRVDQEPRTRHDPLQRWLHKWLRHFRYRRISQKQQDAEERRSVPTSRHYQHTILIASIACRIVVAVVTAAFLVIPIAILSQITQKETQILIVSVFIIIFASLVTLILKTSNLELMFISAAYAATLTVFLSNVSVG